MSDIPHPAPLSGTSYSAAELSLDNSTLWLLDQRLLPNEERYVAVRDVDTVVTGIRDMWVRGAPAIGIAAAYGCVIAAQQAKRVEDFQAMLDAIAQARPTAVNLRWAVEQMRAIAAGLSLAERGGFVEHLAGAARQIHLDDVLANRTMGKLGAAFVSDGATVLTHCNAGALATGGYGTALGVIRAARESGKRLRVYADETRPWLQGARLTAWELKRDGIDVTVICDGAAASLFGAGHIDLAVVGADRITRNGDVANKIGTYGVACLCQVHERPFYVAAPFSTVDLTTPNGASIVIEERPEAEVTHWGQIRHVPAGVPARNPSFDVTPARLISALFTERGVISPVDSTHLQGLAPSAGATAAL